MIDRLVLKDFGCVKDATIELTPLHAFIGPNDSGKSTILRAVEGLATFAMGSGGLPQVANLLLHAVQDGAVVGEAAGGFAGLMRTNVALFEVAGQGVPGATLVPAPGGPWDGSTPRSRGEHPKVYAALAGSLLVRFDPDSMRLPSSLLTDAAPVQFFDAKGHGLPAVYDALVNRNVQAFLSIVADIQKLFPNVKGVRMKNPSQSTKAMAIELHDGTEVGAERMSEGLLYYLAFAVLPYLQPVSVILVEEPENGLHPARIVEVMKTLREVSKTRQVLIATHSPLVVNELTADEVSIVTRTKEPGTKVTRLQDTPSYAERAKVYAPGELWVSYANGEDEGPLLNGGPRP